MSAPLAYADPYKPRHGLPPWLHNEAGGKEQGGPADASIGLVMAEAKGMPWFWNDRMNEWQPRHVLAPPTAEFPRGGPNTLGGMAELWYGKSDPMLVEQIASVPQNLAIVGPSPHTDFVDWDVLLVPGLGQMSGLPAPPGVVGTGGAAEPADEIPGFGTEIPGIGTIGEQTPGFFPQGNGQITPVGTGGGMTTPKKEEPFWTPGKVAVAAAVGAGALAGIVYFATRPKRRKNPRRRRNWVARH